MNRRLFSVIKIFLFAVFTLIFSACSNNVDNTGSANFSISTEVFQSAIKKSLESNNSLSAAFFAEGDFGNKEYVVEKIELKVSLVGDYEETQVLSYDTDEIDLFNGNPDANNPDNSNKSKGVIQVSFDKIPIGSVIHSEAEIAIILSGDGEEIRYVVYKGTSKTITIKSGENPLDVVLKPYSEPVEYSILFYFEDENSTDLVYPGYTHNTEYDKSGTTGEIGDLSYVYEDIKEMLESYMLNEDFKSYTFEKEDSGFEGNRYVYRFFFKKAEIQKTMVDYEIVSYLQIPDTVYDETKKLDEQLDIFKKDSVLEEGEVEAENFEDTFKYPVGYFDQEGYKLIDYKIVKTEEKYIINLYYIEIDKKASLNVYCNITGNLNDPEASDKDLINQNYVLYVTIKDQDNYSETQEKVMTKQEIEEYYGTNESSTIIPIQITFEDIPIDSEVSAEAYITHVLEYDFEGKLYEEKHMILSGSSSKTIIVSGPNSLDLELTEFHPFIVNFYIQDDKAIDTEVPGYVFDYYSSGYFNNYDNFEEDFYKFIMQEKEYAEYTDYDYKGKYDSQYNENGVCIFRVYLDLKEKPSVSIEIILDKVNGEQPSIIEITKDDTDSSLKVAEGYASYKWFIDDKAVDAGETVITNVYSVDTDKLSAGVHYVSVTVTDENGSRWASDRYKLIVMK